MSPSNTDRRWPPKCDDQIKVYRKLALAAATLAYAALNHLAQQTDDPDWHDVEAADHLDFVRDLLLCRYCCEHA